MIGLYFIRKLYNMSMEDLSRKLETTKQTVSKWEKLKIPISNKRIQQLSKLFNIPEKYFQKEIDDMDKLNIQEIKLDNDIINTSTFFKGNYKPRDKNRIEPFLKQLQILWEQYPDTRFGQLVYNLNRELREDLDTFNVEDDEYLTQINKSIERNEK